MSANKSRRRKNRSCLKNPEQTAQDKLIEISHFAPEEDHNDASQILIAEPTYVEPVVATPLRVKRTVNFVSRRQPSRKVYHSLAREYHSARFTEPKQMEEPSPRPRKIGAHIYNTIESNSVFVGFSKAQGRNLPEEAQRNNQMLMIGERRMETMPTARFVAGRQERGRWNATEAREREERFTIRTHKSHQLQARNKTQLMSLKDRIRKDLFQGLVDQLKPEG